MTKAILLFILCGVTFSLTLGQLHFMGWKTPDARKKAAIAAAVVVGIVSGIILGVFRV